MSISVLDTYAATADEVDEEQLPCRRENPELFFAETPQDVEVAKALCLDCPVRAECLAGAHEVHEGVTLANPLPCSPCDRRPDRFRPRRVGRTAPP